MDTEIEQPRGQERDAEDAQHQRDALDQAQHAERGTYEEEQQGHELAPVFLEQGFYGLHNLEGLGMRRCMILIFKARVASRASSAEM